MHQLGLAGMARAFTELEANPQSADLAHAEWLALLLDREATDRYERRLRARLRFARLRHQAAVEDVDYRAARGLDRSLFQALIAGRWIDEAQNLIIEGPAGVGKSWLACALGHKACRDNRSVLYQAARRVFGHLALARGAGRYPRLMRALGGVKLLILDDWGLEPLGPEQRHDMLEIVEDRYGRGATLITSQIPVDRWHDLIGEPTLADAILDRIIDYWLNLGLVFPHRDGNGFNIVLQALPLDGKIVCREVTDDDAGEQAPAQSKREQPRGGQGARRR